MSRSGAIALIVASAVAFGMTYADHAPLIPLIAAEYGLDDLRSGLLSTALFLAYLGVTVLTVHRIDRTSPHRAILWGLLSSVAGTALLALGPGYPFALGGKALQGVGSAVSFIASTRYITALYAGGRSHVALGLFGAGFPLGSALSLLVMPTVATAFGSWRGAIGVEAVASALITVAWTRAPAVEHRPSPGDIRDALRCPNCLATAVQHAAGFGLALSAGTWITVYLLREFTLPLAFSGVLGSLLLLLAVAARSLGGWLVGREHVPTRTVMRMGEIGIVAGVALLAIPGRPLPLALFGVALMGIGVGLPYAAVFNTAAASLPRAPAAAQGLAAIGGTAGAMIGAPLMGYAVQTAGFAAAWTLVGVFAALAFAVTFAMRGEEELHRLAASA